MEKNRRVFFAVENRRRYSLSHFDIGFSFGCDNRDNIPEIIMLSGLRTFGGNARSLTPLAGTRSLTCGYAE